ncbi:MAG: hypothetical protein DRN88_00650 [Candidatus Hydrothermarchaeota archaeon]|nr:MAG: hypothetical protein DRN88_00650 [Candidatus Hydrothermarchaeota archaeon]
MEFLHRLIIGFSAGIEKVMGSGAQAATNIAGYYAGMELGKELLEREIISQEDSEEDIISRVLDTLNLAGNIELEKKEDKIEITVTECHICPKRVGKYPLQYTACPVGGMLTGLLDLVKGRKRQRLFMNLKGGEICNIEVRI